MDLALAVRPATLKPSPRKSSRRSPRAGIRSAARPR